jgi:hypothetical protein
MTALRVLYFAAVRDLAGVDEEAVTVPDDVTNIAQLRVWLEQYRSAFSGRLVATRFARNETFAQDGDAIAAGDVIAIIPPVAGG